MEVKVKKEISETVVIETPYYYKHDLDDCVIYGKIEETKTISIEIPQHFKDSREYTMEIDVSNVDGSYLADKYKSDKEEFEKASDKFKEWIDRNL